MADSMESLVDTLGRMVEVDVQRVDVLKQLADALGARVTSSAPTTNPVVAKLQEIADKEEKKRNEIKTTLENLPTDIYEKFSPRATEVTEELKKMTAELTAIKGAVGGGPGGGGGGTGSTLGSGTTALEGLLKTISTHTSYLPKIDTMPSILENIKSGVDLVAQATKKMANKNFGGGGGGKKSKGDEIALPTSRALGGIDDNAAARSAEMMEEIAEMTKAVERGIPGAEEELAKLLDTAQGTNVRFKKMWSLIGQTNAEMEVLLNTSEASDKRIDKLSNKYAKLEETLYEISHNERKYGRQKIGNLKKEIAGLQEVIKLHNQGLATFDEVEKKQKEVLKTAHKIQASYARWKLLTEAVVDGLLVGNFAGEFGKVMRGNVTAAKELNVESRRFAGSIVGLGEDFDNVRNSYDDLMTASTEVVEQTHLAQDVLQKQYNKQLKKGTRELRTTVDVVNSASAGAWQVGANAESAAEEFQKWNMYMGMSSNGSRSLARTMLQVSKTTGVWGDNLLHAVEAAREVAQLMKDTGIYSQGIADSVVGWMASAQKFGVDKQVKEIFAASQGGLEAYMNASSEVRNLLASGGQIQDVLKGQADPEKVMAGTKDAIQKTIIDAGGGAAFERDASGKPVGLPDLKKLDKTTISRLDLIMKKRFGMKLGQSVNMLEAIKEQNPQTGLDEIDRKLKDAAEGKMRLTPGQKDALELQRKQLEAAVKEKDLNKNLGKMGDIADGLKNGKKTMDDVLKESKMSRNDLLKSSMDSTERIATKLKESGKNFATELGMSQEEFRKSMQKAIATGNADQFMAMNEKLQKANETANTMAKTNSNLEDSKDNQTNVLRSAIQRGLKPIVDAVQGMPLMLFNLITIAGGIIGLYRLFTKNRFTEELSSMAKAALHAGSIYTHDIHSEALLKQLMSMLVKQPDKQLSEKMNQSKKKGDIDRTSDSDIKRGKVRAMQQSGKLDKMQDPNEIWKAEKEKMRIQAKAKLDQKKAIEDAAKAEKAAFDKITRPIKTFWDWTGGIVVNQISKGARKLKTAVDNNIVTPVKTRIEANKGEISKRWKKHVTDRISKGIEKSRDAVKRAMESSLVLGVTHAGRKLRRGVSSAFSYAIDNPVSRGIGKIGRKFRDMFNAVNKRTGGLGKTALLAGGAIGALIAILTMAYQHSEKLQKAFQPVIDAFTKVMATLGDTLAPVVDELVPLLVEGIMALMPLFEALGGVLITIVQILKPFLEVIIKRILVPVLKIVAAVFKALGSILKILTPLLKIVAKVLDAILKPVEWFGDLVGEAASALESVAGPLARFIELIGGVISAVGGVVGGVVGAIGDAASAVGDFFGFADGGLISKAGSTVGSEPVPIIAHVGEAILNGEQQNLVADALNTFMGSDLTPTLKGLLGMSSDIGGLFGGFTSVFDDLLGTPQTVMGSGGGLFSGAVSADNDPYIDYWERLIGVFTGIRSPRVNPHGGLLGGMTKSFVNTFEDPVDDVNKSIKGVDKGIKGVDTSVDRVGDETVRVHDGFDKFGTGFDSWKTTFSNIFNGLNEKQSPTAKVKLPQENVEAFLKQMGINNAIIAHVEGVVASMAPDAKNKNVATTAVNKSDIDEQVRAKVETARPGAAVTAASDQMAEIAANTAASVEELKEVNDNLLSIIDLFNGGGGSSSPNTKPKSKPRSTPNYYGWQFGRFGDTAAKQHNNPGV